MRMLRGLKRLLRRTLPASLVKGHDWLRHESVRQVQGWFSELTDRAWCYARELRYRYVGRVHAPLVPRRLSVRKRAYAGKRCFIIGAAPSLNQMDLAPLNREYTMVVNRGFLLKKKGLKHVTFYGISDYNAYADYGAEIPDDYADQMCVFGQVPWQKDAKHLNVMAMYSEKMVSKYMSAGFFQFNLRKPVAHTNTVILQMVQMAVYAGFKDIYVIGVDNDFSGPNMHFYPDTEREKHNMKVWGINPCADNEKAFAVAYALLKRRGINLYNAGVGGALQALPRVNYESLFQ